VTELLVVLSIVGLLAALLFPVVAQARARARQSVCAANLGQIARATLMYASDNDDRLPPCYWRSHPPYLADYRLLLQGYVKSWQVFYCPERRTVSPSCWDPTDRYRPGGRCMGYGFNWGSGLGMNTTALKGDGLVRPGENMVFGVPLAEVADPPRCLCYGDTNDVYFLTLLRESMPGVRFAGQTAANDPAYEPARHAGGNNFAFVDGHVRWLRIHGGLWVDGGPWVVPDMSMYSRSGHWETGSVP
jgi:prepilin-type processing-associated H-X9-DG protein